MEIFEDFSLVSVSEPDADFVPLPVHNIFVGPEPMDLPRAVAFAIACFSNGFDVVSDTWDLSWIRLAQKDDGQNGWVTVQLKLRPVLNSADFIRDHEP